jgi:hypothetical protein
VAERRRVLRRTAALPLRLYHVTVSPFVPRSCRFEPTCSVYVADAISMHGLVRGGMLGLQRLLRCHPRSPGGYDPVPARAE